MTRNWFFGHGLGLPSTYAICSTLHNCPTAALSSPNNAAESSIGDSDATDLKTDLIFIPLVPSVLLQGRDKKVDVKTPFNIQMRKKIRSERTQTLRAGCSKVEPKIFAPPQTPLPRARDGQNLISWRWSLTAPKNPVWWGSMHTISSYRGNRRWPTKTPTYRTDYNTLRR